MGEGSTTDVLEQRHVVDVPDVSLVEFHLVGKTRGEWARAHRILGGLAHAQIGDLRQGGDKIRESQLSDLVFSTFVRGGTPPVGLCCDLLSL